MKKTYLITLFGWLIPGLFLVGFLIFPDVLHTASDHALASNWFARLFFAVYIMNPFVGFARVLAKPELIESEDRRYRFYSSDEETLRLGNLLATFFGILLTTVVFYLSLGIFFSIGVFGKFILTVLFVTVLGGMQIYFSRFSDSRESSTSTRSE